MRSPRPGLKAALLCGLLAPMLATALLPARALAAPIVLFSTGVDQNGALLSSGATDLHYTVMTLGPSFTTSNYLANYDPGASFSGLTFVPTINPWGSLVDAQVISANVAGMPGGGGNQAFTYRTTFDLTGLNAATAVIGLNYYFDDQGEIALNGVLLPATFNAGSASLTSGFVSGVNTLDFVTYNQGGPGGIRVEVQSASADAPEPASLAVLGAGLAFMGALRRRVGQAKR